MKTPEEILALEERIAREVMCPDVPPLSCSYVDPDWHPYTDANDALEALEAALVQKAEITTLQTPRPHNGTWGVADSRGWHIHNRLPAAICLALEAWLDAK